MTGTPDYTNVSVPQDRAQELLGVMEWAFIAHFDPAHAKNMVGALDWTRTRGVESSQVTELVAVHGSYGYTMHTPGGEVATSGLTIVAVHPAHRRKGLLRSMINDHFARSRSRGEVVSTLIAAETEIYQRFGYAMAHQGYKVSLPRGLKLPDLTPGLGAAAEGELRIRLEDASVDKHAAAVLAVMARDTRPGCMRSIGPDLMSDLFWDTEDIRKQKERLRIAIVEDSQGPAAFAVFRRSLAWTGSHPDGAGSCRAWGVANPQSERLLWSVLADLDLMESFEIAVVPIDDPLLHWVPDIRAIKGELRDQLWLRILDVQEALQQRTYSTDVDLLVDVADPLVAENNHLWHFVVRDGVASVNRADRGAAADVRLSIAQLSAAYLGGVTLEQLWRAGLIVEVRQGSVLALSDAMRHGVAPRSTTFF